MYIFPSFTQQQHESSLLPFLPYLTRHQQHAAIATQQRLEVDFLESSDPDLVRRLQEGGFHGLLVCEWCSVCVL